MFCSLHFILLKLIAPTNRVCLVVYFKPVSTVHQKHLLNILNHPRFTVQRITQNVAYVD